MTTPTPAHTAAVFEESHGRSIGYQRGCRCERCVGWRRDYDRRRYRRLHPDRDISEAEVRRRWPHVAAAIEAAAVARHVRDTGCEGLLEALHEKARKWRDEGVLTPEEWEVVNAFLYVESIRRWEAAGRPDLAASPATPKEE